MEYKIYSVYDNKAQVFSTPIFQANDAVAIRAFGAAVKQEGNDFNVYAEDYSLWCLGVFDDVKGEFSEAQNSLICEAVAIKALQAKVAVSEDAFNRIRDEEEN